MTATREQIEEVFNRHYWIEIRDGIWVGDGPDNNGVLGRITVNNWVIFYAELDMVIHTPHRGVLKKEFADEMLDLIGANGRID